MKRALTLLSLASISTTLFAGPDLFDAIRSGDRAAVTSMASMANTARADGTTPLMVASGLAIWNPGEDGGSLMGQEDEVLEAVKMCVELGNDVNAVNRNGETALHGAALTGANSVVRWLIDHGARMDAVNRQGMTPLNIAEGIHLAALYKVRPQTAALLRDLMSKPR